MAHEVCTEVGEWIEEQVQKPVEQWIEQQEKVCREQACNWWCLCCNKWFCWIVTTVVKVVTWVLVTVSKWVVHTVCEVVATVVDTVVAVVTGLVDVVVGIVTWNWARVWDGLLGIVGALVGLAVEIFRVVTLGDTVGYFRGEINEARLRDYVRGKLDGDDRLSGRQRRAIKDALGIDHGAFGFRVAARAVRTFVRSDFRSAETGPPDLVVFDGDSSLRLRLKELAGLTYSEFFRRFRPEIVADDGSSVSGSDLDAYLSSGGGGKQFSIFAMDRGTLQTKLGTAAERGRQLGLMLRWRIDDVQVTRANDIREPGFDRPDWQSELAALLVDPVGRSRKSDSPGQARADLCTVTAVGIFFYTDNLNGLSAHLETSTCLDGSAFPGDGISGVTFKDRLPDFVWKFVPIHEIGHYFGLCHVDGLDRIMFSAADHSWLSWSLLPEYLWLSGEPGFTLEEAKRAWDYILANFEPDCLATRAA